MCEGTFSRSHFWIYKIKNLPKPQLRKQMSDVIKEPFNGIPSDKTSPSKPFPSGMDMPKYLVAMGSVFRCRMHHLPVIDFCIFTRHWYKY